MYSKFRKISIETDIPINFLSVYYIKSYLKKLNIQTLEDLFNAHDKGIFNDDRKRYNMEIKSQTEMLMSYYMETPLIVDQTLEERIYFKEASNLDLWFNQKHYNALVRSGLASDEIQVLYNYMLDRHEDIISIFDNTITILKVLKKFADDKMYQSGLVSSDLGNKYSRTIQNIKFKSKFFEKHAENRTILGIEMPNANTNTAVDNNIIKDLESQIQFLKRAKENLNNQIDIAENQLSIVKKIGSIRK